MFLTILIFLLILSFLILCHEFGHFIFAKFFKVKVEEFGLGLPPRLFGFYKEGKGKKFIFGAANRKTESTIYSLNLIPFGGFNKIYGEEIKEEKDLKEKESFAAKSLPQRALIVLGGVLVGFLSAVVIFYFVLASNNFSSYQGLIFDFKFPFGKQSNFPMLTFVSPGLPAEKAKLAPYDLILEVDGKATGSAKELSDFIKAGQGKELLLTIKNLRTKEMKNVVVLSEIDQETKTPRIGIARPKPAPRQK